MTEIHPFFCIPSYLFVGSVAMLNHSQEIITQLKAVRLEQPLVHSISNFVTLEFTANALLAIGASPIMAHAIEEVAIITKLAKALVINIGTLDQVWLQSMKLAMCAAKENKIPIVIDPVGAGATTFRTQAILELIHHISPTVIRGNAAEIIALSGETLNSSKGVDSIYASDAAYEAGLILARKYHAVIVISGKQDFIIAEEQTYKIENGDVMMRHITGMGCIATALIAAFCAINSNFSLAAAYAMALMGLAGEVALQNAQGPGSFKSSFLDALFNLQEKDILARLKFSRL